MDTSTEQKKIGKYEVLGILGQGGMGTVYRAFDRAIGREVAIKMLAAGMVDSPDLLKRFYLEARAAGNLRHPNIVVIYDLGDEAGIPYMVMELLTGQSLDKMISDRQNLPLLQKLEIVWQVCNALHFAHQHGMVHRDVKPANVIVTPDGQAKLVDFGIVRASGGTLTRAGQIVGTLNYMSPEQLNSDEVDARTDVFSAGVMLYQLLTGVLPFEAPQTSRIIAKILTEPPVPLSAHLKDYPPELDEMMNRALAKRPEDRYGTADDFAFHISTVRDSLKRGLVDDYLEQARAYIAKSDFSTARDVLTGVLKLETSHGTAKQLMMEVQRLIEQQQLAGRVQSKRQQVEQALAARKYEEAAPLVEQALRLEPANTDLLRLRDLVQQAGARQQEVHKLLREAESARQAGELEKAKEAAAEALQLDPADTRATVIHGALLRQIAAAAKKKQVSDLLNAARQEIAAERFTAAQSLIEQAEAASASDLEIQPVKELAADGLKRQLQRKEIQVAYDEIQSLMAAAQWQSACDRAAIALAKYGEDPTLVQIKALAEQKRSEAGRPPLERAADQTAYGTAEIRINPALGGRAVIANDATMDGNNTVVQDMGAMLRAIADGESSITHQINSTSTLPQRLGTIAEPATEGQSSVAAGTPVQEDLEVLVPEQAPEPLAPQPLALPKEGRSTALLFSIAGAVLLLALIGSVIYVLQNRAAMRPQPGAEAVGAPAPPAYLAINAVPWGTVLSVTSGDGKVSRAVNEQTPVRLELPPGEYNVVVAGPNGERQSQTVKVTAGNAGDYEPVFGEVDVQQIINNAK